MYVIDKNSYFLENTGKNEKRSDVYQFAFPLTVYKDFPFSTSLSTFVILCLLMIFILTDV